MNYIWVICRTVKNPDTLGVVKQYYFDEDRWTTTIECANRYSPDQTWHILEVLHRLYDENKSPYITIYPSKVSNELVNSWAELLID